MPVLETGTDCDASAENTCVFGASCKSDQRSSTCQCDGGFEEDEANNICSKHNVTYFLTLVSLHKKSTPAVSMSSCFNLKVFDYAIVLHRSLYMHPKCFVLNSK